MTEHQTGTREEHLRARIRLLEAEKEHTRRDYGQPDPAPAG